MPFLSRLARPLPGRPLLVSLLLCALVVYLGIWLGYYTFARGLDPVPGAVWQSLINWDAKWYLQIAAQGYQYPAAGPMASNIIFFPLYPLGVAALHQLTGVALVPLGMILALLSGGLSIALFYYYALGEGLESSAAQQATLAYSLWPAAFFFFSFYPTGLMNCLVLAALLALQRQRPWQAVCWAGLGTASGPLMVFFSFALWGVVLGREWRRRSRLPLLARAPLMGLMAISGLGAFMLYQAIRFGAPLAFIHGHGDFIGHLSPSSKLWNILTLYPFWGGDFTPLWQSLLGQDTALNPARSVYFFLNALALGINLAAILVFGWRRAWARAWLLLVVTGAYLWFQGASQGPVSTYRLLYIDVPLFLLMASLPKSLRHGILLGEAVALVLQSAFFVSGHWAF